MHPAAQRVVAVVRDADQVHLIATTRNDAQQCFLANLYLP
jgi:hypothetical protein